MLAREQSANDQRPDHDGDADVPQFARIAREEDQTTQKQYRYGHSVNRDGHGTDANWG